MFLFQNDPHSADGAEQRRPKRLVDKEGPIGDCKSEMDRMAREETGHTQSIGTATS